MKTLLSTLLLLASAQFACADNTTLVGAWLNTDSSSIGVTRLLIKQTGDTLFVSTYGKCMPIDCPWGETPLNITGPDTFQFGYVNSRGLSNFTVQRIADDKLELKLTKQLPGSASSDPAQIIHMQKVPAGPNVYIRVN
jgi:hypothetical protein